MLISSYVEKQKMIIRNILFILIWFLLNALLASSPIYFMNNLIEDDGKIYKRFTMKRVTGEIHRMFDNPKLENVKIGRITRYGKNGKWTRWWENGFKKSEGCYIDGKKVGYWVEWNKQGTKSYLSLYENGNIIYLKNCLNQNCDQLIN